jgi:ethanolamine ammonia-lyase large subunit
MGCDICYTNHAVVAGLRPAPEFEAWLQAMGIVDQSL